MLDFLVTFDEAWTGDVSVSLYDSDWTPADRLLATASATGAVVNGDFVVTGTFSMQGRASRAGIPVTLTWGGTLETYGPSASTIDVISNNFTLTLKYGGDYTLTTLQPRYLNVTTALGKTITALAADRAMLPLELKGGNAVWRDVLTGAPDNVIDTSDASLVGTQYGSGGTSDGYLNNGDCNFDGKVNIQDLAHAMIDYCHDTYHSATTIPVDIIGIRPGEKLSEELISRDELGKLEDHGEYFIIKRSKNEKSGGFLNFSYSSGDVSPLSQNEIRKILYQDSV